MDIEIKEETFMVDLSIVIVSWNTRELLRECLESLYKCTTGIMFEVFVVDNMSSDDSVHMVRDMFPGVNLIANDENIGFSRANNQAIKESNGRYIALLNPDTMLIGDVFSPLVQYADNHMQIGAIGPKIFRRDGRSVQYSCARNLPNLYYDFCRLSGLRNKFPLTKLFGGEYMTYWDHNDSRCVEALAGACMIVRKKTIDEVGLMDENQFMYSDEIDWCKRLKAKGWDIYYLSESSIIHYGGESVKQLPNAESGKSRWYYYMKHKGVFYAFLYSLQVCVFNMCKYIWSMFFRSNKPVVIKSMQIYRLNYIWSMKKILGKE